MLNFFEMKMRQLLFSTIIALFLIPSICFSQHFQAWLTDLRPGNFNFYEGVNLSSFEVEKIKNLRLANRAKIYEVGNAFLFPDDKNAEVIRLQGGYYAEIIKILNEEEMKVLEEKYTEKTEIIIERQTLHFMERFDYLDLSYEQAMAYAKATDFSSGKKISLFPEEKDTTLLELLTEEQLEKYKIEKERLKEPFEGMSDEDKVLLEERKKQQSEEMKFLKPFISGLVKGLEEFYIPERALVRGKLEKDIFANEEIMIDELREFYLEYLDEQLEKEKKLFANMPGGGFVDEELKEMVSDVMILMKEEIVESEGMDNVLQALHTDKEMFYQAKWLAERFDKQIDGLQKEVDLLEAGMLEIATAFVPNNYKKNIDTDVEQVKKRYSGKKYNTAEIEYKRNIAFLLAEGIVGPEDEIGSDRGAHSLHVFPVPALNRQTIYFELKTDGKINIEIISQDGKLLRNIYSGELNKGQHNMEVNISNLQSDVFFYRVSGEGGVSIAKSMKG